MSFINLNNRRYILHIGNYVRYQSHNFDQILHIYTHCFQFEDIQ